MSFGVALSLQPNHSYEFGPFLLNVTERLLLRDGNVVPLTPKAFDLLLALIEHHGRLLGKGELMMAVWPDTLVEEGNLSWNISHLRKALSDGESEQQFIETVPKHGYRFVASVKEVQTEGIQPIDTPPTKSTSPSRRQVVLAVAVCLLLALSGVWLYQLFENELRADSLVVLPFSNGNADPEAEYLSDGITESLINNLARLSNLRVIARATAFQYKGKEFDPPKIGQKLNVSAILMGKVVLRDDTLIVQVDLVDTAGGRQLWGERYTRKLSEILTLQDEITSQISEQLSIKLTTEEQDRLTKRHTDNAEAYQLYVKGRYFWNKATEEGLKKGIEYFSQAVERDPDLCAVLQWTG